MCGLVGWISGEKGIGAFDRRKFIDQALIMDTVRGGDSTGVFVVNKEWDKDVTPAANWLKQLTGGHEFVLDPDYQKLWAAGKIQDYKYCVGHNRSATVGGVVLEAAHPFTEGPITLVHNGTVKKEYTSEKELANDSHGICWRLSKDSPEEVIKSLDGAFALIWHDARDDSLNFVRNKERPLHMAKVTGNDTIFFASEAEMLYWLDRRLNLRVQDIVSMKAAHWLKFKPDALMIPEVKPVELYSPKAHQSTVGYTANQWSGTGKASSGYPSTWTKPDGENLNSIWMRGIKNKSHAPNKRRVPKSERKWHEIPEKVQDTLLDYGMLVDEQIEFIPISLEKMDWGKHSNLTMSVYGWAELGTGTPLPAVMHGVTPVSIDPGRVWTALPLGITMIGWNIPMVVCRLVSKYDKMGALRLAMGYPTSFPTKSIVLLPDYKKPEPKDHDLLEYPGPNNTMLTAADWIRATAEGCMSCGDPLTLKADAWDTEWFATDTGTRPMCGICIRDKANEGDTDMSYSVNGDGSVD